MNDKLISVTQKIAKRVGNKPAFGHKVKILLSDVGTIYVDGTGDKNHVTNDAKDADLTLKTTLSVMQEIDQGSLDAFSAYMQGKLSIEGDQSIAVAFGALLES